MIVCFLMPRIGIHYERTHRGKPGRLGPMALLDEEKIVVAVSQEAGAFGVTARQTRSAASALCPKLSTLLYDRPAYEALAAEIWDVVAAESSFVEPVSPEKCFAVLDDRIAIAQAKLLTGQIVEIVGDDVRAGLGRTKLIAGHAASSGNPILCIARDDERDFLGAIPLSELPIDVKEVERLYRLGFVKLKDLSMVDDRQLPRSFKKTLQWLLQLARGNDADPVRPLWPLSTLKDVIEFDDGAPPTWDQLESALRIRCEDLAAILLGKRQYCRVLSMTIVLEGTPTPHTQPLSPPGKGGQEELFLSEKLASPACDSGKLFRGALRLLRRLYDGHAKGGALEEHTFPIRSVAIDCAGLDIGSGIQQTLLDIHGNSLPDERRRALDSTLGLARSRWGEKAVVDGSMLLQDGQRSLYTGSLGSRMNEKVEVVMEGDEPVRYLRDNRLYPVTRLVDRWHERRWNCGRDIDRWIYQAQTPSGLVELWRIGDEWRLRAIVD